MQHQTHFCGVRKLSHPANTLGSQTKSQRYRSIYVTCPKAARKLPEGCPKAVRRLPVACPKAEPIPNPQKPPPFTPQKKPAQFFEHTRFVV